MTPVRRPQLGHRLGLRARATAVWAALALVLSVGLSLVAYELIRSELMDDRQDTVSAQAYLNARLLRSGLRASDPDVGAILSSLATNTGSQVLARIDGTWFSGAVGLGPAQLPEPLTEVVAEGSAGDQVTSVSGVPHMVVGVPIAEANTWYFELASLADIDATLDTLGRQLAVAAAITTVAGAAAGWWASRRVVRPVQRMSTAATKIADGELSTRLDALGDPDLEPLQRSFNRMADAVEDRIERERRFASDVSHELRSPLASMMSTVAVARRRVHDAAVADEVLVELEGRMEEFSELVTDLLEISRLEAGVADFNPEPISPVLMAESALASVGATDVPVVTTPTAPETFEADKRRIGQALMNLIENADRYAGGATRIVIDGDDDHVAISVEDAGPGIPLHERDHVLRRFARGDTSRGRPEGTGLGLALVVEHVRLHGGHVEVGDAPGGGARFTLHLPVHPEAAA